MTRRLDKALEVLDVGLQHAGDVAYGTDRSPDRCARCQRHDPADGDLCTGCRAFLLGDSDDDPQAARPTGRFVVHASPPADTLRFRSIAPVLAAFYNEAGELEQEWVLPEALDPLRVLTLHQGPDDAYRPLDSVADAIAYRIFRLRYTCQHPTQLALIAVYHEEP